MKIQDEFNNIANTYDANRRKFIPCFDEFYAESTDFLSTFVTRPRNLVDLGAGTGLLTYYWMKHFPNSDYTLVDVADEMLNIAKKRFGSIDNVSYKVADYVNDFSFNGYDTIISALSVHHLENDDKVRLFKHIYDSLPKGGAFVNYDQFCTDDLQMNQNVNRYWENYIINSGLSDSEILKWRKRQALDRECSVSREISMLTDDAKFGTVECIYKNGKFAVIVAIKGFH